METSTNYSNGGYHEDLGEHPISNLNSYTEEKQEEQEQLPNLGYVLDKEGNPIVKVIKELPKTFQPTSNLVKPENLTNKFMQQYGNFNGDVAQRDNVMSLRKQQMEQSAQNLKTVSMSAEEMQKQNQLLAQERLKARIQAISQSMESRYQQPKTTAGKKQKANPMTSILLNYILPWIPTFALTAIAGFSAYSVYKYFSSPKATSELIEPSTDLD